MAVGSIFAADAFVKKNRKPISYSKRDTKKPSEIIGRAKTDKVAKIAQSIKDQIFQLAGLSAEGSALAALEMFRIAGLATNSLNSVARKRPDLFTSIAATRVCWPMLWESHPDIVEENKAFAQDLTLGSQTGINYSQVGKTFSFKVPANHVAIYLNLLAQALRCTRINKWDLNATALLFPVFKTERANGIPGVSQRCGALEDWANRVGKMLPPFSRSTVKQWKSPMRELFRLVYGEEFDEHPHLQQLKHSVMGHAKDVFGKCGSGVIREAMVKKVLQAVHSIAPLG